jgi:transketolase
MFDFLIVTGLFVCAVLAIRSVRLLISALYLAGTSAAEIPFERPRRLHCLGIRDPELRRYGSGADHRRAHGLDAAGIARSLAALAA